jgi:NADH-quinone oxidoreductase subunit A
MDMDRNIGVSEPVNGPAPPCTFLCTALRVAKSRKTARFRNDFGQISAVPLHADNTASTSRQGMAAGRRTNGRRMSQTMSQFLLGYLPLIVFVGVATAIGLALLASAFLLAYKQPDPEKLSAYECGFNAFDDARMKFDVRFYLVAILFIIFDLEVTFLFPWATAFGKLGAYGFWSMMAFLAVLTIGFIYEWKKGALEWD